ncbi:hypothetical protein PENSPDRAFT_682125 [Peniophora sp. CONT]|nr:hypothetical protein PENSPDRAFT_682125 [Peniophora sp. CONT]
MASSTMASSTMASSTMASSTMGYSIPIYQRIPHEVWEVIFEMLLDELSSARPLLPDSDIHAFTVWTPGPDPGARPPCVPYICGYTRNGVRSGQAYACSLRPQQFERRGIHALLHVDRARREYLRSFRQYLAFYRLIDVACRAHDYPVKSPDLICSRGLCACGMALAESILRNQLSLSRIDGNDDHTTGSIRRIQLIFPSIDEQHAHSSSTTFMNIFRQYGAPKLEELDLRTDGSYASPEQMTILPSPSIVKQTMLNINFVMIGESLTDLELAAETDHFTWRAADICRVLRGCPSLERVQLLTIFDRADGSWAFRSEAPIELKSLARLHVRADGDISGGLIKLISAPVLTHVHVDMVSRNMAQSPSELGWATWHCVIEVANLFPEALRSTEHLALSLHCQHDRNEDLKGTTMPQNWPEFMRLCVRPPTNGDVTRDTPSFTFTSRYAMDKGPSVRAILAPEQSPGSILNTFFNQTLSAIRYGTGDRISYSSGIQRHRFTELVLTGDAAMPSAMEWPDLLRDIYRIRRLYVHGIDGKGADLERLVMGLSHVFKEDMTGVGGGGAEEPFLVVDQLEEVHLPDWDFERQSIPQDHLAATLSPAREFAFSPVAWSD